jgi:hypothetical protein
MIYAEIVGHLFLGGPLFAYGMDVALGSITDLLIMLYANRSCCLNRVFENKPP